MPEGCSHFNGVGATGWRVEDSFGLGDVDDMLVQFTIACPVDS